MFDVISVVLPVFIVVGAGYLITWKGFLAPEHVDGLMKFAQGVAIPLMLFRAISELDLAAGFDPLFLAAFYGGATTGFLVGLFGARWIFGRDWEDAVAIGFVGLFSNSLLLGIAISERAYGTDSLSANFAIIAVHSPYCYMLGITTMEVVRAQKTGATFGAVSRKVIKAMVSNTFVLGVTLGIAFNLSGFSLPEPVTSGMDMIARAGIPAALFGLGGVLLRYRPEGDMRTILFVTAISLVLHPAVTWGLANAFGLSTGATRSAVITAAMAPGINAYLFANMYDSAKRVAASAVLLGTFALIVTAPLWIAILP